MSRELGEVVINRDTPPYPENLVLKGSYVTLTPTSAKDHASQLFDEYKKDKDGKIWDYMGVGPFENRKDFKKWLKCIERNQDPYFLTISRLEDNMPCGLASYMRIKPQDCCIEVGNISYTPSLQNTIHATEAMYLMMNWAFSNGYRRYEWKCNSLNRKSRKAAQRLGFNFEGVFLQHLIVKGRNRDTAWFAIIDKDWPELSEVYTKYLNMKNFDLNKNQKVSLSSLTIELLKKIDPSL